MRSLPQPQVIMNSLTALSKPDVRNESISAKGSKKYILPSPDNFVSFHPIPALEPLLNNVKEEVPSRNSK